MTSPLSPGTPICSAPPSREDLRTRREYVLEDLDLEQHWFEKVTNDAPVVDAYDDAMSRRPAPRLAARPNPEEDEGNGEMPSDENPDDDGEPLMFKIEMDG